MHVYIYFSASSSAMTMFIAILVTCHVFQPVGFMLAIIIAFLGFFVPMTRHRIPHECMWQNPVMLGGLIMGVCNTVICYFFAVWPHILIQYIVHVHVQIIQCVYTYTCSCMLACTVVSSMYMYMYTMYSVHALCMCIYMYIVYMYIICQLKACVYGGTYIFLSLSSHTHFPLSCLHLCVVTIDYSRYRLCTTILLHLRYCNSNYCLLLMILCTTLYPHIHVHV